MRSEELISEVSAAGSHFFDRDTMRFFGSRLCRKHSGPMCTTDSTDGRYSWFVTSEKRPESDDPRRYSVRRWDRQRKTVDTIGEFQQYRSAKEAASAMYAAATEGRE